MEATVLQRFTLQQDAFLEVVGQHDGVWHGEVVSGDATIIKKQPGEETAGEITSTVGPALAVDPTAVVELAEGFVHVGFEEVRLGLAGAQDAFSVSAFLLDAFLLALEK